MLEIRGERIGAVHVLILRGRKLTVNAVQQETGTDSTVVVDIQLEGDFEIHREYSQGTQPA